MNNLYIVESPLQALCALEVSLGKPRENHCLIVRLSDGGRHRNDQQILYIINQFNWNDKLILTNKSGSLLKKQFNILRDLSRIKNKYRFKISELYISEFRYPFMHMARAAVLPKRTYLLDDGAASITVINNYIMKGYNYPVDRFYPTNTLKKIFFTIIFKKYLKLSILSSKINIISSFTDIESQQIKRLDFSRIKEKLGRNYSIDKHLVYYFGSKYSESGIISLDYELSFLSFIRGFYENKKVIYFAHRDESTIKLEYLSQRLNFEIIESDLISELYLLQSDILPDELSGAYTSVLNNLSLIFPNVAVRSFKFNMVKVSPQFHEDINKVYKYYNDIGIAVENHIDN